jgi:hypothetical protein
MYFDLFLPQSFPGARYSESHQNPTESFLLFFVLKIVNVGNHAIEDGVRSSASLRLLHLDTVAGGR